METANRYQYTEERANAWRQALLKEANDYRADLLRQAAQFRPTRTAIPDRKRLWRNTVAALGTALVVFGHILQR